jgi:hypothetical protein
MCHHGSMGVRTVEAWGSGVFFIVIVLATKFVIIVAMVKLTTCVDDGSGLIEIDAWKVFV